MYIDASTPSIFRTTTMLRLLMIMTVLVDLIICVRVLLDEGAKKRETTPPLSNLCLAPPLFSLDQTLRYLALPPE